MTMLMTVELDDTHIHALQSGNSIEIQGEPAALDGDQMTRYIVTVEGADDMQRFPVTVQRYDLAPADPPGLSIRFAGEHVDFLAGPRGGAKDVPLFRDGKRSGYTAWVLGPRWNN
jgi:hypothetical protein